MARPCSTDRRERALLAGEDAGCCGADVARRSRVGISTLRLRRRQVREA